MNLTIAPLTDRTGAEVIGLDATRPIDAESRAAPGRAFADHLDSDIDECRYRYGLMLEGEVPA